MKKIFVTGASGFIGANLVKTLNQDFVITTGSFEKSELPDFNLENIDVVVHLAGIAHKMNGAPDELFYSVNQLKTVSFAGSAKMSGVKHFIFMSTVKVFGCDFSDQIIAEDKTPSPNDAYGKSKHLAEIDLLKLADESFKVTIFRTPVVYGAGVKGNLLTLMKLIDQVSYVPLGNVNNSRSMIYVKNLTEYIRQIIIKEITGIILPADKYSRSTSWLVSQIAIAMDRKIILIKLPTFFYPLIKLLFRKYYDRLFCSLQFDNKASNERIGYSEIHSDLQGIEEMIVWYRNTKV